MSTQARKYLSEIVAEYRKLTDPSCFGWEPEHPEDAASARELLGLGLIEPVTPSASAYRPTTAGLAAV